MRGEGKSAKRCCCGVRWRADAPSNQNQTFAQSASGAFFTFQPVMFLTSLVRRTWSQVRKTLLRRDHFSPHAYVGFEGYYSRTQLDDGGTLAVIFCWVKDAPRRANLVHVSYTPPLSGSSSYAFKHEFFPERMTISAHPQPTGGHQPFTIDMQGVGTMKMTGDTVEYAIRTEQPELKLDLRITDPVPWSSDTPLAGPMGILSLLSRLLPLNWHILCTSSKATYSLSRSGRTQEGAGVSHVEKNWGTSFPPGWIWSQSFTGAEKRKSLCLAGGAALPGVEAYLVGYRSPSLHWDFRPPFAMATRWFSPFMKVHHCSKDGTFQLVVQTFCRKLVVKVDAPKDSFLGLAAPLADGHRPMFAFESFVGRTWVEAWGRAYPWQQWTLLEEGPCGVTQDGVPCSALEFGGSFCHLVEEHTKKED